MRRKGKWKKIKKRWSVDAGCGVLPLEAGLHKGMFQVVVFGQARLNESDRLPRMGVGGVADGDKDQQTTKKSIFERE